MLNNSPVIEQLQVVDNGDKSYVFRVMRVGCSTETEFLHHDGTWYGSTCRDGVYSGYFQTVGHAQQAFDCANDLEIEGASLKIQLEMEMAAARAVKHNFPVEVET